MKKNIWIILIIIGLLITGLTIYKISSCKNKDNDSIKDEIAVDTKSISYTIINEDKLSANLKIASITLSTDSVILRDVKPVLESIKNVTALIDLSNPLLSKKGEYVVENLEIVLVNEKDEQVTGIEMKPTNIKAFITVTEK